ALHRPHHIPREGLIVRYIGRWHAAQLALAGPRVDDLQRVGIARGEVVVLSPDADVHIERRRGRGVEVTGLDETRIVQQDDAAVLYIETRQRTGPAGAAAGDL